MIHTEYLSTTTDVQCGLVLRLEAMGPWLLSWSHRSWGENIYECGFVHLPTLTFLQLHHPCLQGLMDCKEYIVINH